MKTPKPSRRERIALFRLGIIGDLLSRELEPGQLKQEFEERAKKRYRPPGAKRTRTFHFKTLQRWYYAAKADLAGGLLPRSRARGFARKLDDAQRDLLLQMRMENPSAAAELVLSEAVRNGIVAEGQLSEPTLRRLYRSAGLPRVSQRRAGRKEDVQRRRWQAEHPGDLWHGDVCHLAQLDGQGRPRRVLVHGLLDDASRYCTALMPRYLERERDMLEVFCGALLRHPAPKTLYLDNGACYSGELLQLVCKRLGIHLVHAKPYSPEARGKMERFWRTMRQRCTDHLPPSADAHQVGVGPVGLFGRRLSPQAPRRADGPDAAPRLPRGPAPAARAAVCRPARQGPGGVGHAPGAQRLHLRPLRHHLRGGRPPPGRQAGHRHRRRPDRPPPARHLARPGPALRPLRPRQKLPPQARHGRGRGRHQHFNRRRCRRLVALRPRRGAAAKGTGGLR
ncbi:MAG: transposase family protein [Acidobacteria bacterium]|nr:transposase family protein [Acidobacteriota bacterium]